MSRSHKKTPRYGDINKKSVRTLANNCVRAKLKDNPDCISFSKSNAYRKLFDSYNICEFNYFCDWSSYWGHIQNQAKQYGLPVDMKKSYKFWIKHYYRK